MSNSISNQHVSAVSQRLQDIGHQLFVTGSSSVRIVVDIVSIGDQERRPALKWFVVTKLASKAVIDYL